MNAPMQSVSRIRELLSSEKARLREFHVRNLWLFGSIARGDATARDVDMLVEFDAPPTLLDFMNLKFLLEERLGKPVDLHSLGACPPRFFKRIQPDLQHVA